MNISSVPQKTFRKRNLSGFTLVEILIVVVLIGVFLTVSVPLLGNFGAGDLKASARRLSGNIKYLFNEAAISGFEYRLTFDLDQHSYHAKVQGMDGTVEDVPGYGGPTSLKGSVQFMDVEIPGRGKYSSGQITARIHPSGWVEEMVIHLKEEQNILSLRVVPLSGETEFFQGYRDTKSQGS